MTTIHNIPFVSVITPTFNRRPFIPTLLQCYRNQTYPVERIEFIIVDDGTDKIDDLIKTSCIPQIRYYQVSERLPLGKKRNLCHSLARGDIFVYMDDDDYYPPERISHAVQMLQHNPKFLIAGSGEIYIYYKHINKMYQCGPYSSNHATAGTFAFRKELLNITAYNESDAVSEEHHFLKGFTIPMIQLNPLKTILVFEHEQNTFDKKKLLSANQSEKYFKVSTKTIDDFIKYSFEETIKDFFTNKLSDIVSQYTFGDIKFKPEAIEQNKIIDKNIELMN